MISVIEAKRFSAVSIVLSLCIGLFMGLGTLGTLEYGFPTQPIPIILMILMFAFCIFGMYIILAEEKEYFRQIKDRKRK